MLAGIAHQATCACCRTVAAKLPREAGHLYMACGGRAQVSNELSVVEKEATELFLQELIFEMSDYFLCVVNDFTSLDQRYLDK